MASVKLFFEAMAAIPGILDALKGIGSAIIKMQDALTEKNIQGLKSDVADILEKIENAKTNNERAVLIADLNKRLRM